MGANCCKPESDDAAEVGVAVKTWKRPKWKSDEPMTEEQLQVGGREHCHCRQSCSWWVMLAGLLLHNCWLGCVCTIALCDAEAPDRL